MVTLKRLRESAKALGIRRFSVMKIEELVKVLEEAEKEKEKQVFYKSIYCDQCLREQQKQKIIDEHTYNEKAMANVIRQLVCKYCRHKDFAVDGPLQICRHCGLVLEDSLVSDEGDYLSHKVRHK